MPMLLLIATLSITSRQAAGRPPSDQPHGL